MSLLHRLVKPLVTITIIAVASWLKKRSRLSQKKRLIEDEIIVVVGASSGVGLEVARLYASNSGESPSRELHLVARSDMQALRDEIMAATNFESINTHRLDACNEHDLASLAKKLASGPTPGGNPRVDTLIICTGALTTSSFAELCNLSPETLKPESANSREFADKDAASRMASIAQASYDVNVLSCLKTISAMLPLLAHSHRPRIAVLSSVAAEIPAPTRSIYAANKAALSMFLRSLRIELEDVHIPDRRPVGISIVHPASIKTGLRGKAFDAVQTEGRSGTVEKRPQSHEKSAMTAEYVAQQVKRAIDEEIDEMWLPKSYWWVAKVGMVLFPDLIAAKAKKKYNWIM